jgi:hypothetical protein
VAGASWREPLLHDPRTFETIADIARARRLVLYCGAGTTRDQTGLGWEGLVEAVFDAARQNHRSRRALDDRTRELIRSPALGAQQKASIVVQKLKPAGLTETEFLSRVLRRVLYEDRGWGEGSLLRNIATLASDIAVLRRDVVVVTTNYDDYLLRDLLKQIDAIKDENPAVAPGLEVRLLGRGTPVLEVAPGQSGSIIKFVYLHGFVPEDPKKYEGSGDLVFSERSYVETQDRTANYLNSLMVAGTSFLAVGASLSDPPLISALIRGADDGANLHALIDLPGALSPDADDDIRAAQAHRVLSYRAEHLGIKRPLLPATFSQVAQVVEEVRLCASLDSFSAEGAALYAKHGNYAARLASWWAAWAASAGYSKHTDHHTQLAVVLKEIESQLARWSCARGEDEMLRLEMWVRLDPSISREQRDLTLFANSSGPILDTSSRRREPIRRRSAISSVRAFGAGKPLLTPLSDLGFESAASRWKTFLSVPILHDVAVPVTGAGGDEIVAGTGTVPVGVVTLSSTYPMARSGEEKHFDIACFADPRLGNDEYDTILRWMIEAGRAIATVDSEPGPV